MKLHLTTFNCQFDEASEMVTVIGTTNLALFLSEHGILRNEFNPDFVNESLDEFVFCTNNKEWREFVNLFYSRSETKIVLHDIPTPNDFDIYRFFNCNQAIVHYTMFPERRNHSFLMESSMRNSHEYFIKKMASALKNPSVSKIRTFYQFKMYWNKNTGGQYNILSYRKRFFTWLSTSFPRFYCWFWDHVVTETKIFSESFRTTLFVCSNALINREIDGECAHSVEADLPF